MSEKILLTGAGGLIGSNLLPLLLSNHKVIAIGNNPPKINHKNLSFISCDFSEDWRTNILPSQVDTIIHLAQSENFRDFPEKAENIFSINTISTLKLLEYGRKNGVKKFIYASSGGIYGTSDNGFNEEVEITSQKNDIGFYLETKFHSELLAGNYTPFFTVIILRFFFVYGKEQKENMLFPRLINSIRKEIPVNLSGENGIKINPIHVSDAAEAIVKTLDLSESHKINIAGTEILSIKEIAEIIGEKLGKRPLFSWQEIKSKNLIGDIDKMCKLLVTPQVRFEQGINLLLNE